MWIGLFVLSAGLLAYVAVRQSYRIRTVNLGGRDAMLAAFGAAVIIYSLARLIIRKEVVEYFLSGMVLCGILFFNRYYWSYQQDYYRQLGFQYQLAQQTNLEDASNIVYLNADADLINIQHFYSLNGNARMVYGDQNRLIMGGFSDTAFLQDEKALAYFIESGNYHMSDYDRSHKRVDAVVCYSFDVSLKEVVRMKFSEWLDGGHFLEWLEENSHMTVYLDGSEGYERILREADYENTE